ncbi:MAG: hypothetical protein N3A54_01115 [Patescibacteria group bacterium]|nr:hypothetical protein [Patescibacteria group bacterium]
MIRDAFRVWLQAAKRLFRSDLSWVRKGKLLFGLVFAQPLTTVSLLLDFKWFALNRFVNWLSEDMGPVLRLPQNEEERRILMHDIADFIAATIKSQYPLLTTSENVIFVDDPNSDWYYRDDLEDPPREEEYDLPDWEAEYPSYEKN